MVNYPHKLSSKPSKTSLPQTKNFANRGMSFEKMINATNDYYLSHGIAVIHKSQPQFRLFGSTTLNGVALKLLKPILDKLQLLTTRVFMKDFTLISKQKKPDKKMRSR